MDFPRIDLFQSAPQSELWGDLRNGMRSATLLFQSAPQSELWGDFRASFSMDSLSMFQSAPQSELWGDELTLGRVRSS